MADVALVLGWGLDELLAMPLEELLEWHRLARERAAAKGLTH